MSQEYYQAPPKASSIGIRLLVGCLGFFLLGLLACGGFGYFAYTRVQETLGQFTKEYTDKGYVQESGQMVQVSQSPTEPTVYFAQSVTISVPVQVDVAIIAQVAQIKADIQGDLDFMGQSLMIQPEAVIHGDLHIKAGQSIIIQGKVLGKISGDYQVLQYNEKTFRESEAIPELGESSEFKIDLESEPK